MTILQLIPSPTAPTVNFSGHARYRMIQMNVTETEVLNALNLPEVEYGDKRRPGHPRRIVRGGDLEIVIDPITDTVVTVYWRQAFTQRSRRPAPLAA